uniref:E2F transcription factor 2 n=1 Tax=Nothoprocta perdicaria TaxID=30464 RepID=A0A8C7EAM9_NOTPE
PGCSGCRSAKQQALRQELAGLARTERTLDRLLQDCTLQLKGLPCSLAFSYTLCVRTLAYVTYQDLRAMGSFKEQTVMAVKAPPETRLEVPDFQELQLHLRSSQGPIEVYLCPEEAPEEPGTEEPVPAAHRDGLSAPVLPCSPEPPRVEAGLLGSPRHLLQHTEDQLPCTPPRLHAGPFVAFSPPLAHDDYLWGLDGGEGVGDLFEAYDLGDLLAWTLVCENVFY